MDIRRLIPKYAILPLAGMLLLNFFTYNITPIWTQKMHHYSMETGLDEALPFLPVFVIPYILAFSQWILGYLAIARTDKQYCYRVISGEIIAKFLVCICFILLPTTMQRAEITGTDICSRLVAFIYRTDTATNLFPSIHCLESWICYRGAHNRKYFSRAYETGMLVMTILVFLSTVFIKQHVVLDMVSAVAVCEIGLFVSGRLLFTKKEKSER